VNGRTRGGGSTNPYRLSTREFEVLRLLAEGRKNKQIAHDLSIEITTVNKHVSHILIKMRAASRTDAVAKALREALMR
jgi:DNA-binding NarL/FixJ family response regulator